MEVEMRPDATSDQAAIHAVAEALLAAVNGGDVGAILACWAPDGVLLPPHHPAVHGHAAMAAYFSRVFAARRLTFTFTGSVVVVLGDAAVEHLTYASRATPLAGGDTTEDIGKGLHVCARQPSGAWKITHDIWNSDRPLAQARADAQAD
jgi:uncharacterized protein (TIGR02246 family)